MFTTLKSQYFEAQLTEANPDWVILETNSTVLE